MGCNFACNPWLGHMRKKCPSYAASTTQKMSRRHSYRHSCVVPWNLLWWTITMCPRSCWSSDPDSWRVTFICRPNCRQPSLKEMQTGILQTWTLSRKFSKNTAPHRSKVMQNQQWAGTSRPHSWRRKSSTCYKNRSSVLAFAHFQNLQVASPKQIT